MNDNNLLYWAHIALIVVVLLLLWYSNPVQQDYTDTGVDCIDDCLEIVNPE